MLLLNGNRHYHGTSNVWNECDQIGAVTIVAYLQNP